MKVHSNAQKLLVWLRENPPPTVAQISALGILNTKQATEAVQYMVRQKVLEPERRAQAKPSERVRYKLTGRPLPTITAAAPPSFDGLLNAWGIQRPSNRHATDTALD